ncbi:MAG: type VI secretion system baseplate subunit TssE [Rhodobacteraceae bacterium]|nr:type VI secretion system baseplate subunit TssE [Paracoccaceae bacterium]MCP5342839.1 type VI secretion system baseplate subunit TssE [Paracoccaceae bacterium]
MADKTLAERLQPSLLDRLTDDHRDKRSESREDRVIDVRRLRDIIQRDLSWLLNANNGETLIDGDIYPNVRRSVLNYGVREASGDYTTKERANQMRASILRAIEDFEPRIKRGTLDVTPYTDSGTPNSLVVFDIRADMWAQPLPLELYLRSEVDVTTGHVNVERKA